MFIIDAHMQSATFFLFYVFFLLFNSWILVFIFQYKEFYFLVFSYYNFSQSIMLLLASKCRHELFRVITSTLMMLLLTPCQSEFDCWKFLGRLPEYQRLGMSLIYLTSFTSLVLALLEAWNLNFIDRKGFPRLVWNALPSFVLWTYTCTQSCLRAPLAKPLGWWNRWRGNRVIIMLF